MNWLPHICFSSILFSSPSFSNRWESTGNRETVPNSPVWYAVAIILAWVSVSVSPVPLLSRRLEWASECVEWGDLLVRSSGLLLYSLHFTQSLKGKRYSGLRVEERVGSILSLLFSLLESFLRISSSFILMSNFSLSMTPSYSLTSSLREGRLRKCSTHKFYTSHKLSCTLTSFWCRTYLPCTWISQFPLISSFFWLAREHVEWRELSIALNNPSDWVL